MRMLGVVGARPNFMKMAPVMAALTRNPGEFDVTLVHTGQHYDGAMSQVFFDELGLPRPDINLNVGSGSQTVQTAAIMTAFEPILDQVRPDAVIVVGDVTSTIACALVAAKAGVDVAHVESGLRSFDRTMPEEMNRVLTDHLATWLFTTEPSANTNLRHEGIDVRRIHFVGNVMIDTLLAHRSRARALNVPERLGLEPRTYAVLTLHRPSNVEDPRVFEGLMTAIRAISHQMPIVFPVHPRTRKAILASTSASALVGAGQLRLLEPLGYLDFIGLVESGYAVLTDSGGIQEETTILDVPCLTLRTTTERPVTVSDGTNRLVGCEPAAIIDAWHALAGAPRRATTPELWDGRAAERIADVFRAGRGLDGLAPGSDRHAEDPEPRRAQRDSPPHAVGKVLEDALERTHGA